MYTPALIICPNQWRGLSNRHHVLCEGYGPFLMGDAGRRVQLQQGARTRYRETVVVILDSLYCSDSFSESTADKAFQPEKMLVLLRIIKFADILQVCNAVFDNNVSPTQD